MQQCFFVNRSVIFVPRKDEAFPSINKLRAELRPSNFPPGPAQDDRLFFLGFVPVVVISSNNNDDILSLFKENINYLKSRFSRNNMNETTFPYKLNYYIALNNQAPD